MVGTHVEFASGVSGTTCPGCAQDTVKVAVLVNGHGLVLAHGTTCVQCGAQRHRAQRRARIRSDVPAAAAA